MPIGTSFDEIFDAYWLGRGMKRMRRCRRGTTASRGAAAPANESAAARKLAGPPDHVERAMPTRPATTPPTATDGAAGASRAEALSAATDLRHIVDPEEIARTHALAERLAHAHACAAGAARAGAAARPAARPPAHHPSQRVAMAARRSIWSWRRRKKKPLRLVVLLDASGSMSLYTAFFVRFLHGVVDAFREAEAFVFHTRLVHVSASLARPRRRRAPSTGCR